MFQSRGLCAGRLACYWLPRWACWCSPAYRAAAWLGAEIRS